MTTHPDAAGAARVAEESGFHHLGAVADFTSGKAVVVTVDTEAGSREVLVSRQGEQVFVTDALCPHLGKSLDGALLRGSDLVCPFHGASFDLAQDGQVLCGPAVRALKVFPCLQRDGEVYAQIPPAARGPFKLGPA